MNVDCRAQRDRNKFDLFNLCSQATARIKQQRSRSTTISTTTTTTIIIIIAPTRAEDRRRNHSQTHNNSAIRCSFRRDTNMLLSLLAIPLCIKNENNLIFAAKVCIHILFRLDLAFAYIIYKKQRKRFPVGENGMKRGEKKEIKWWKTRK